MNDERRRKLLQEGRKQMKDIMAVKRINLDAIWFASEQHQENFKVLFQRFTAIGDTEYTSACYICAHPEIYSKPDWNRKMENPFSWYWGADDEANDRLEESGAVGILSSAYRELVRASVELFTGRQQYFDLPHLISNAGDEVYRLFIQMLEIRRDRYVIDLWSEVETNE